MMCYTGITCIMYSNEDALYYTSTTCIVYSKYAAIILVILALCIWNTMRWEYKTHITLNNSYMNIQGHKKKGFHFYNPVTFLIFMVGK